MEKRRNIKCHKLVKKKVITDDLTMKKEFL